MPDKQTTLDQLQSHIYMHHNFNMSVGQLFNMCLPSLPVKTPQSET